MNYREAVEAKIIGEADELTRLKGLWEEIVNAFEEGGEESIKKALSKHADKITNNFNELIVQLRNKL